MGNNIINKLNILLGDHDEKIHKALFASDEFASLVNHNVNLGCRLLRVEIVGGDDGKIYTDYVNRMGELKNIFFELSAYMEILENIYSGQAKNIDKMGNFMGYIHKSILHFIVITLKELLVGSSNLCLCKMEKFLRGNKRQLFDDFKIKAFYQVDSKGKVFDIVRPVFNILPLLDLVRTYIENESDTVKLLKIARNKVCSHLPTRESYDEIKDLCYKDLLQVYEELYEIFNAISLAQNWNKSFKPTFASHGIGLKYIDDMAGCGEKEKRASIDGLRKDFDGAILKQE
ncbi:MAG: hypothetical protein R3Y54_13065 [Eubacteriales bacterium]